MKTGTLSSARLKIGSARHLVQMGGLLEAYEALEEASALLEEYKEELFTEIQRSN